MKFSLSIALAAILFASSSDVHAAQTDCLDAKRYNLEVVCRKECEKGDAVAFSVSYNKDNDTCRCFRNIDGFGTYIGSGDRDSQSTCYSMATGT